MKYKDLREQPCYRCNKRAGEPKDKKMHCCFICKPIIVKELDKKDRTSRRAGKSMLRSPWEHCQSIYLTENDVSRYFRLTSAAIQKGFVGTSIKEATRLAHIGNWLIHLKEAKQKK